MGRDDTGYQIKRNEALSTCTIRIFFAVHRESNTHPPKDDLRLHAALGHGVARLAREPVIVEFVMFAYVRPSL